MLIDEAWAERLSRRATLVLILGLLVFSIAEGPLERATGKPTTAAMDRSLCAAAIVATGSAIAMGSPLAAMAAGGVSIALQCGSLIEG